MISYEDTNRLYARLLAVFIYNRYTTQELKEAEKLLQKALTELQEKTTHKTITHKEVNQFEWYDSKKEALRQATKLNKQGINPYIAGKRARIGCNYHDMKIAAIMHNKWNGNEKPWIIAWHD